MTGENIIEMLFAALVMLAGMLLALAGLCHGVAATALFLWSGEWLSPIGVLELLLPSVGELPWIAAPEKLIGAHKVVTSTIFAPIGIVAGLVLALVGRVIAAASRR